MNGQSAKRGEDLFQGTDREGILEYEGRVGINSSGGEDRGTGLEAKQRAYLKEKDWACVPGTVNILAVMLRSMERHWRFKRFTVKYFMHITCT